MAFVRIGQIVILLRLADVRGVEILKPYALYAVLSVPALAALSFVMKFGNLAATFAAAAVVSLVFGLFVLRREST